MPHAAVLGAGLAGLAAAFHLRRLGWGVTLLDAAPRAGGNVGTLGRHGYLVELGPNGFLDSKPGMLELCRTLGIDGELVAASEGSRTNRYVLHKCQIERLPGGPLDILTTPLLSLRGKLELLGEPLRRVRRHPADESVAAFAERRLGKEAARVFLEALVTGVHAADPDRLSLGAAFPRLAEFEGTHGGLLRGVLAAGKAKRKLTPRPGPTRMWSFPDGLQRLVDALMSKLEGCVELGVGEVALERDGPGWRVGGRSADAVVVATPAGAQSRLLARLDPALSADLAAVDYSPVAVVALGYRVADCPLNPDGFGYIAPPRLKRDVLGVQWCSRIFPGRAPDGMVLWRALCGGALRPDVFAWDDATLIGRTHAEMEKVMRVRGCPAFTHVVRWPKAIPHYSLGHLARQARVEAGYARHPGLFAAGNAFGGVAMNDVAEGAGRVAERVAAL